MVFIEYIPGNSFFHRADVRSKIVWLLFVVISGTIFNSPVVLAVLLLFVFIVGLSSAIPYRRIWTLLKPLLPLILFIIAFTGFTGPAVKTNEIIFQVLGARFTTVGVELGITFVLRLFLMVISLSIVTLTTPLEGFFGLLTFLRAPFELAFAVATAIRFVPTLESETYTILDAQRVRGIELEKMGFVNGMKAQISVMIPMIIGGIRKSESLTQAMLARGFGASKKRTTTYELKMKASDYATCTCLIVLFAIAIYMRLLGYGIL
jgi:energy-coupling factor transport system permease protein